MPPTLRADTLSLTAVEIGLVGWMAVLQLVLFAEPDLMPGHAAYWFRFSDPAPDQPDVDRVERKARHAKLPPQP